MKAKLSPFSRYAFSIVVLTSCLAGLNSCATRKPVTNISASWKAPEAANYKDFFIAVLAKNLPARSTMEGDIAKDLKREGVKAAKSFDILGHNEKLETAEEKKAAVEKIQSLGYDAIMVITLIKKTEESRYVEGTSSYEPTVIGVGTGYYNPVTQVDPGPGTRGAFGVYYMDASTAYNTPGYYETDKIYFVESRLFDAKTSKLIWSAQSETFYPGNIDTASHDFSYVMVEALKKANLIFKKEKK